MSKLITIFTILFISCALFVYSEATEYPLRFVHIENAPDHVLKTTSVTMDKFQPGPGDTLSVKISWKFNKDWRNPKTSGNSLDYFDLVGFLEDGSDFTIDMTAHPEDLPKVKWANIATLLKLDADTKRSKSGLLSFLFGNDWEKVKDQISIDFEGQEFHCIVNIPFPSDIPAGDVKLTGSISSGDVTWIKFAGTYNKNSKDEL